MFNSNVVRLLIFIAFSYVLSSKKHHETKQMKMQFVPDLLLCIFWYSKKQNTIITFKTVIYCAYRPVAQGFELKRMSYKYLSNGTFKEWHVV